RGAGTGGGCARADGAAGGDEHRRARPGPRAATPRRRRPTEAGSSGRSDLRCGRTSYAPPRRAPARRPRARPRGRWERRSSGLLRGPREPFEHVTQARPTRRRGSVAAARAPSVRLPLYASLLEQRFGPGRHLGGERAHLGPFAPVPLLGPLARGVDADFSPVERLAGAVIELVDRPFDERKVALRVEVRARAPNDLRRVLHVDVVVEH